jgi:hypothetical protein
MESNGNIQNLVKSLNDSTSNIPQSIFNNFSKNLHKENNHPIYIIGEILKKYFMSIQYKILDEPTKIINVNDIFGKINKIKLYHINNSLVLRPNMSSNINIMENFSQYIILGDVYKKNKIDTYNYPISHQILGMNKVPENIESEKYLSEILSGIISFLFPKFCWKLVDCSKQNNNWEKTNGISLNTISKKKLIMKNYKWGKIAKCEIIQRKTNLSKITNWINFTLHIDRIAMGKFSIPDIRLLWTSNIKCFSSIDNIEHDIVKKNISTTIYLKKIIEFSLSKHQIIVLDDTFIWNKVFDFYELVRKIFGNDIKKTKIIKKYFSRQKNIFKYTFKLIINPLIPFDLLNQFNLDNYEKIVNDNLIILSNLTENQIIQY